MAKVPLKAVLKECRKRGISFANDDEKVIKDNIKRLAKIFIDDCFKYLPDFRKTQTGKEFWEMGQMLLEINPSEWRRILKPFSKFENAVFDFKWYVNQEMK